ncbi:hypothetical protein ACFSTA_08115 [Ornithinibacillus salinisoli]|uniref:Uncharacterized protein n=1 Tax=Ornithinibacillus salinisoli TaxID=1848459 RepID=A0ABW4VYF0_9BACI
MYNKETNKTFQQKQQKIIQRLEMVGIQLSTDKKIPRHGVYSGIVGDHRKILKVNIPNWYDFYRVK